MLAAIVACTTGQQQESAVVFRHASPLGPAQEDHESNGDHSAGQCENHSYFESRVSIAQHGSASGSLARPGILRGRGMRAAVRVGEGVLSSPRQLSSVFGDGIYHSAILHVVNGCKRPLRFLPNTEFHIVVTTIVNEFQDPFGAFT